MIQTKGTELWLVWIVEKFWTLSIGRDESVSEFRYQEVSVLFIVQDAREDCNKVL